MALYGTEFPLISPYGCPPCHRSARCFSPGIDKELDNAAWRMMGPGQLATHRGMRWHIEYPQLIIIYIYTHIYIYDWNYNHLIINQWWNDIIDKWPTHHNHLPMRNLHSLKIDDSWLSNHFPTGNLHSVGLLISDLDHDASQLLHLASPQGDGGHQVWGQPSERESQPAEDGIWPLAAKWAALTSWNPTSWAWEMGEASTIRSSGPWGKPFWAIPEWGRVNQDLCAHFLSLNMHLYAFVTWVGVQARVLTHTQCCIHCCMRVRAGWSLVPCGCCFSCPGCRRLFRVHDDDDDDDDAGCGGDDDDDDGRSFLWRLFLPRVSKGFHWWINPLILNQVRTRVSLSCNFSSFLGLV